MTEPAAIRLEVPAEPAAIRLLVEADPPAMRLLIPGETGPAGGETITRVALTTLSGHRAVLLVGLGARYPDLQTPADAEPVAGVTLGAADQGAPVTIKTVGELVEPSWSWTPGPVFCGSAGVLVQAPPYPAAWLRQVGVAVAPDRLLIQLRPPILLT